MNAKVLMVIMALWTSASAYAMSELDAEVSDFQVHLKKAQNLRKPKPKIIQPKRIQTVKIHRVRPAPLAPALVAQLDSPPPVKPMPKPMPAPIQTARQEPQEPQEPIVSQPPRTQSPELTDTHEEITDVASIYHAPARRSHDSFFYRFTANPFVTIATFNGPDSSYAIARNVSNPYNGGVSGALLLDLNLLGSRNFVIESGAAMMVTGAYTGNDPTVVYTQIPGFNERVSLTYLGVPINLKWLVNGENSSSPFIKVGAIPAYLISAQYDLYGNTSYAGQTYHGGFNDFDVMLNAAAGFSLKISKDFHLVAEGGWFQGVLQASKYFTIYNTGFSVGGGIAYIL